MKRKISSLILCTIMIICSVFVNPKLVSAAQQNAYGLKDSDLIKINKNIDRVLSSKYEAMKTLEFVSNSDIIEDPKLSELNDKNMNFFIELSKKVDSRINDYTSEVNIDNISKESNDKYIANVTYSVEFKLVNSEVLSKSTDEKYRVELVYKNNDWYITKLLDLDTDIDKTDIIDTTYTVKTKSLIDNNNTEFPDYENILDSKISTINDVSNDIDTYYQNFKIEPEMIMRRSYSGYNHSGAVEYAHKWANGRNPEYKDFVDVDCTNFVSQCAYEGGGIPSRSIPPAWTPAKKNDMIVAKAWTSVTHFYDFMTSMGYASSPPDGVKHGSLGDVIQFYNQSKGDYTHAAILTKLDNTGIYYSAHSKNRYDYPVWLAFDGTYTNIRLIKFW
jgi:Putative amidase domain